MIAVRESNVPRSDIAIMSGTEMGEQLWYSLIDVYNSSVFEEARKALPVPPVTPDGYWIIEVANIDTVIAMINSGYGVRFGRRGSLNRVIGLGRFEVAQLYVDRDLLGDEKDEEFHYLLDSYELVPVLRFVKENAPSILATKVLSTSTYYNILSWINSSVDTKSKFVGSISGDVLEAAMLFITVPYNLGNFKSIPDSFTEIVIINPDKEERFMRYLISIQIDIRQVLVLMRRGAILEPETVKYLLRSYKPSLYRDEAYYIALMRLKMSEPEFLEKYMPDSNRLKRVKELFYLKGKCDSSKKFSNEGCTNETTIIGADLGDVPSVYVYRHKVPNSDAVYCFNVLEIANQVFANKSYTNPYTNQPLPQSEVDTIMNMIISLRNEGYPLYPVYTTDECSVPIVTVPTLQERVLKFREMAKLGPEYNNEVQGIVDNHSAYTILALKKIPNVIRFYNGDLLETIVDHVPGFREALKAVI